MNMHAQTHVCTHVHTYNSFVVIHTGDTVTVGRLEGKYANMHMYM